MSNVCDKMQKIKDCHKADELVEAMTYFLYANGLADKFVDYFYNYFYNTGQMSDFQKN